MTTEHKNIIEFLLIAYGLSDYLIEDDKIWIKGQVNNKMAVKIGNVLNKETYTYSVWSNLDKYKEGFRTFISIK